MFVFYFYCIFSSFLASSSDMCSDSIRLQISSFKVSALPCFLPCSSPAKIPSSYPSRLMSISFTYVFKYSDLHSSFSLAVLTSRSRSLVKSSTASSVSTYCKKDISFFLFESPAGTFCTQEQTYLLFAVSTFSIPALFSWIKARIFRTFCKVDL